jgi:hypothetical protein
MNKADFITLITTKLPNGTNLPSADHRETMITNPNSIGELVYGDALLDNQTIETYTIGNSNFDYNIRIYKTGNNVNIGGTFTAKVTTGSSLVFRISNTDLIPESGFSVGGFASLGTLEFSKITINPGYLFGSNALLISGGVFINETYRFNINYKSQN